MNRRPLFLFAALLPLMGSLPTGAAQSALGSAGEIYRVHPATANGASALVLETLRPGEQAASSEIVPGTEDEDIETNPTLVFENASGAVFLLWQRMASGAFPVLNLSSHTAAGWSPAVEIRGNPFAFKSAPQLLVTRDVSISAADGARIYRTVIHIAWAEEDGGGAYSTFYTPLILENGVFLEHHQVYRIASFDHSDPSDRALPTGLLQAPRLQPGSDDGAVVLVFAHGEAGRIASLEIRVLPRGLVSLGDGARAHIIGAAKKVDPKSLASLAASARSYVLSAGVGLRNAIIRALADDLAEFLTTWEPANGGGPQALADDARAHIIGAGSELGGDLAVAIADRAYEIDEIPAPAGGPAHALRFSMRSSRVAPQLGEADTFGLFASADGSKTTVAWALPDRLVYRESAGAGWSAPRELMLVGGLTRDAALAMLGERSRIR